MKGLKGSLSLLIGILLSYSSTSAYDVAQTCQIVPNNTYVADPTSCAGWALCVNGAPEYGQCTNDLLYNSFLAMCDYADDVTCISTDVTTLCAGLNDVYKANPTNCQSYCYCENGVTGCTQCPAGQIYDPTSTSCVYSSSNTCAMNSPCALVPNNIFVANTANCAGYYQCEAGVGTAGTCPNGYLYNAIEGICDYPQNVVCPSGSSSSGADTAIIGSNTTCANLTSGQYFANDGSTCQGYFYCSNGSSTAAPVWGDCPAGSHFSQSQQQCVSPYAVACQYNRCEGVTYTFVTAINTNCTEYDICSNGLTDANSEAACPTDYPYFDEAEQSCVQTEPSYAVC